MMNELIIYRAKKIESILVIVSAFVCLAASIGLLSVPVNPVFRMIVSVVVMMVSLFFLILHRGMTRHGLCRKGLEAIKEFEYPPLNEWAESLEERGAFEVEL